MKKKHTVITLILFFTGAVVFSICFLFFPPEKEVIVTKKTHLVRLEPDQYGIFKDSLGYKDLKTALEQSLEYYTRVPNERVFRFGEISYTRDIMIASLERFAAFVAHNPSPAEMTDFIRTRYTIFQTQWKNKNSVLFTGYYEPTLQGSLERNVKFTCPVYSVPDDLVRINLSLFSEKFRKMGTIFGRVTETNTVVPYYTRKEINAINDFKKRASPVVWLENPVDRLFLEIQGSGRVVLDSGGVLRLHYAAKNGRQYRSIGKHLIDQYHLPKAGISMQTIRRWLKDNPEKADDVMNHNASFVFFKKERGGPYGCLGVPVTPMRSIATDTALFPKGALCFIKTTIPGRKESQSRGSDSFPKRRNYSGFALNQDTGGAIKGPLRADLFFGSGEYAAYGAGHMKYPGKLYFLVLKKAQIE